MGLLVGLSSCCFCWLPYDSGAPLEEVELSISSIGSETSFAHYLTGWIPIFSSRSLLEQSLKLFRERAINYGRRRKCGIDMSALRSLEDHKASTATTYCL
jgi:hypothetical protein